MVTFSIAYHFYADDIQLYMFNSIQVGWLIIWSLLTEQRFLFLLDPVLFLVMEFLCSLSYFKYSLSNQEVTVNHVLTQLCSSVHSLLHLNTIQYTPKAGDILLQK